MSKLFLVAELTSQCNQAHVYFRKYDVIDMPSFSLSLLAGHANPFLDLLIKFDTS